jgi:hypothetical protein
MPWNREKVRKELDRKTLVKGVEEAIFNKPGFAAENILDLLESNQATKRQIINCMYLIHRLIPRSDVDTNIDRFLEQIYKHLNSLDKEVVYASARGLAMFAFGATRYVKLVKYRPRLSEFLDIIVTKAPELAKDAEYIIWYTREYYIKHIKNA